jgi:hypothetical protein
MSEDFYSLELVRGKGTLKLSVEAINAAHANAQAQDICKALQADKYKLNYKKVKPTLLSDLFKDLATSNYDRKNCCVWEGKYDKDGYPCIYIFKQRIYVKNVILRYLDIPKENSNLKLTCNNKQCINPYHFNYTERKNEKFTSGDTRMLLAYAGQGVSIEQIAKAFNVHRSTVYRKLHREHFYSGCSSNS